MVDSVLTLKSKYLYSDKSWIFFLKTFSVLFTGGRPLLPWTIKLMPLSRYPDKYLLRVLSETCKALQASLLSISSMMFYKLFLILVDPWFSRPFPQCDLSLMHNLDDECIKVRYWNGHFPCKILCGQNRCKVTQMYIRSLIYT